jgi:hypothetical protein
MSLEHITHALDEEIDLSEHDGMLSVRCDDEVDGNRCDNYIDVQFGEFDDLLGLGWNRKQAEGARALGWVITLDHDYCPQHGARSLQPNDVNQARVGTSNR